MKYKQFHCLIIKNGWKVVRQTGGHIIYSKESHSNIVVPTHSGEIPEPLRRKIMKDMGLK